MRQAPYKTSKESFKFIKNITNLAFTKSLVKYAWLISIKKNCNCFREKGNIENEVIGEE